MDAVDLRIDQLRECNQRLTALLADPNPGLVTWVAAVVNVINKMRNIANGTD
jgi:hypothetical protein